MSSFSDFREPEGGEGLVVLCEFDPSLKLEELSTLLASDRFNDCRYPSGAATASNTLGNCQLADVYPVRFDRSERDQPPRHGA